MGEAALIYSIKDYIEMEENSLEKLEFHEGEIFAIAGGTLNHGLSSSNIGGSLRELIKEKEILAERIVVKQKLQFLKRNLFMPIHL